jgi:hypothetical protein
MGISLYHSLLIVSDNYKTLASGIFQSPSYLSDPHILSNYFGYVLAFTLNVMKQV